jgi:hypothetical protein
MTETFNQCLGPVLLVIIPLLLKIISAALGFGVLLHALDTEDLWVKFILAALGGTLVAPLVLAVLKPLLRWLGA